MYIAARFCTVLQTCLRALTDVSVVSALMRAGCVERDAENFCERFPRDL